VPSFGGSLPGLPAFNGLGDIIANIKETVTKAAERAKTAALPPGSAWGSRNVPPPKPKYEMPDTLKPKLKEETKKALRKKSKIGSIKKEEPYIKEKNPEIPSHKVVKKLAPSGKDGQENTADNKAKAPKKPENVSIQGS